MPEVLLGMPLLWSDLKRTKYDRKGFISDFNLKEALMDPIKNLIKKNNGWALVAYAYNHSYLGG
jgi:hypothetical protein